MGMREVQVYEGDGRDPRAEAGPVAPWAPSEVARHELLKAVGGNEEDSAVFLLDHWRTISRREAAHLATLLRQLSVHVHDGDRSRKVDLMADCIAERHRL